jgi:hypothetical protein
MGGGLTRLRASTPYRRKSTRCWPSRGRPSRRSGRSTTTTNLPGCGWGSGRTWRAFVSWQLRSLPGVALGEQFEESYVGEFDSLGDYAEELATDIGDVTGSQLAMWPFTCIDWERAGRELEFAGDIWSADASLGRVWIFR